MTQYTQSELEVGAAAEETDGMIIAGNGAEVLNGDDGDDVEGDGGRPEDCVCEKFNGMVDLPCFACHVAGFETVADE